MIFEYVVEIDILNNFFPYTYKVVSLSFHDIREKLPVLF